MSGKQAGKPNEKRFDGETDMEYAMRVINQKLIQLTSRLSQSIADEETCYHRLIVKVDAGRVQTVQLVQDEQIRLL